MHTVISSKFQVVIPKPARERLPLQPSQKLSVIEKDGMLILLPQLPLESLRGMAAGAKLDDYRDKRGSPMKPAPGSRKFCQKSFSPPLKTFTLFPCWMAIVLLALFVLSAWSPALAQETPVGYSVARVFAPLSFTQPLLLLQAPDNPERWYVVEQPGTIRTFLTGESQSALFADLRERVLSAGNEQGLLGMAFHPGYPNPLEVFLSYTATGDGRSVISRFAVNPGGLTLNANSEQDILEITQPLGNHNGGHIVFGPEDGFLYIGLGDGGGGNDPLNNAQNTTNLLGALLRIDVDVDGEALYSIPPDNPFAESDDCFTDCPEIYAWGLRNPWRFSFDAGDPADLWLGDVGQNAREEVNLIELGGNYGWPCFEGNRENTENVDPACDAAQPDDFTFPEVEYAHGAGDCSITGGFVYRGTAMPELIGRYIFGDFCTGRIWAVVNDDQGQPTSQFELLRSTGRRITSFGQDQNGEVYVIDRAGGIYQLQPRFAGKGLPWVLPLLDE